MCVANKLVLALLMGTLSFAACDDGGDDDDASGGSGSGGSGSGGGGGGAEPELTFTAITGAAENDPMCPTITPEQLNADDGDDGDDDDCDIDQANCSGSCSGDGFSASFTISGTSVTGTIQVNAEGVDCAYDLEATVDGEAPAGCN